LPLIYLLSRIRHHAVCFTHSQCLRSTQCREPSTNARTTKRTRPATRSTASRARATTRATYSRRAAIQKCASVAQQVLHLLHVLHLSHVHITGHFVGRHISYCGAAGESSLHLRAYLSIYQIQEARARLSIVSISTQVIASRLHGNSFQSFWVNMSFLLGIIVTWPIYSSAYDVLSRRYHSTA